MLAIVALNFHVGLFEVGIAYQSGGVVAKGNGFSVQPHAIDGDAGCIEENGVDVILQAAKLVGNGSQYGALRGLECHIQFHVDDVHIAVAFVSSGIGVVAEQVVVLGSYGHGCQCQLSNKEKFLHDGNCENTQTLRGGKSLSVGVAPVLYQNEQDNEKWSEHRITNIRKIFGKSKLEGVEFMKADFRLYVNYFFQ